MGHLHKAAMSVGLICGTGCEPPPSVYELDDEQKAVIAEHIDNNDRTIPLYEELLKRADKEAVFDAGGEGSVTDFAKDLHDAQALLVQYQKEGRIYGFDYGDPALAEHGDAGAFFYRGPIEEDQYIAMAMVDGEIMVLDGGIMLHEAAHKESGLHSPEVKEYLAKMTSQNANYQTKEFVRLVQETKDYSYLVSLISEVPDEFLQRTNDELWWPTEGIWEAVEKVGSESKQQYAQAQYEQMLRNDLFPEQAIWAEFVVDNFRLSTEALDELGLTRNEIIDVLSHETTIYPEAREEYTEALAEFKRMWVDTKENTEAALPEEADEEVMEDEADEGQAEGEEGSHSSAGRR